MRMRNPAFQLDIGWVKGHSSERGNERADGEAKVAAKGCSSHVRSLPGFLADGQMPISIYAWHQKSDSYLKSKWRAAWAASPRHDRIHRIDPSLPSKSFRKLTKGLSRNQTSALAQLRSGHVPLNVYLHRINKASSPGCASCLQGDESVHHFLFECRTWNHERWQMEKALGREAKSAACIMSTEKGISELLKYVGHTGRLKATFGDVLPPL
jgi:hypothetical protein